MAKTSIPWLKRGGTFQADSAQACRRGGDVIQGPVMCPGAAVFFESLRTSGEYRTPARPDRTLLDRAFGGCSAWYHARVLAVVVRAGGAARRGLYTRERWAEDAYRMLSAAEACGAQCRIEGFLPAARMEGPKVFVANHMSALDTYLLPGIALALGDVATVVKESLLSYPVFGSVMRAVRPIAVSRQNPRRDLAQVLEQGTRFLEEGRSVVLFPQASRRREFVVSEFNSLGVKLAARAGVPVVAAALKTDFHGIGRWMKDFGAIDRRQPIRARFSEPIRAAGRPREAQRTAVAFIARSLRDWGLPVVENVETDGGEVVG